MSNFKIRPPAIPFRHAWTRLESQSMTRVRVIFTKLQTSD